MKTTSECVNEPKLHSYRIGHQIPEYKQYRIKGCSQVIDSSNRLWSSRRVAKVHHFLHWPVLREFGI
jgi:hypothetical protein